MSFAVARPEGDENLAGKSPPPDSDPFSDAEFGKISSGCQASSRQLANRRFQFHKCSQLFIRTHNETLSIVAVRVCNRSVARWNQSLPRNPNSIPLC
jgi:hypothetical protein